ncbi:MAG: DUF3793 family protein [Lachnospiraceae bacterium]|nr:DUF3793 family protein [Lachnospiraceae bacterium]
MPERYVIEHCSPTLAGIKTGNLFRIQLDKLTNLYDEIRELNNILICKGLRAVPVKVTGKDALVYIYRPDFLEKDLSSPEAIEILESKGYSCNGAQYCLVQLIRHLAEDAVFPHEIGLFLGYPPSDVRHFMADPCQGVKCSGCWKAYSDADEAEKTFDMYKKCTDTYKRLHSQGRSLSQLVVEMKEAV